ncbi:MAG: hypothetical protein LC136_13090, partial [Burkholderiales bacterium]|nr:hypothetical protein [Burkholderiales bacterium]
MRARTGAGTGTARAIVRAARLAAAVAFAAVLAGCAWAPGFWLGRPPPERSAAQREADSVVPVAIDWGLIHELDATARAPVPQVPTGDAAAYRIGPGDALRVTVWNHPDLNLPP